MEQEGILLVDRDFTAWYPELPPVLAADHVRAGHGLPRTLGGWNGPPLDDFDRILARAIVRCRSRNPQHNH